MSGPLKLPPCPEWCENRGAPEHVLEDLRVEGGDEAGTLCVTARHEGPSFGPFSGSGEIDVVTGQGWFKISADGMVLGLNDWRDPAELLQLAQHAEQARRWLAERQEGLGSTGPHDT